MAIRYFFAGSRASRKLLQSSNSNTNSDANNAEGGNASEGGTQVLSIHPSYQLHSMVAESYFDSTVVSQNPASCSFSL